MSTDQLDAVAAGRVKLEDITSSERNKVLLGRIKDNDPSLTWIQISWSRNPNERFSPDEYFYVRERDDLIWLGHFIGLNTTLTDVCFHHITGGRELSNFFIGLNRNKKIRTIRFWSDIFHDYEGLSSMNMPHILILTIRSASPIGENGSHYFALGLRNCKSLKEFYGNVTPEILAALSVLPRVEKVTNLDSFDNVPDNVEGWFSFDQLLKHTTTLFDLSMSGVGLGDRGLTLLSLGLTDNNTLKKCFLSRNNIGDEGAEALAKALLYNQSVEILYLDQNNIGDIGVISLAKSLDQCSLRELSLMGNSEIADRGLVAIAGALQSHKCMLQLIRLGGINIGSVGMLLGRAISNSMVTSVDFSPPIGDEGEAIGSMGDDELGTVMEGLTHGSTLRVLDLSGNEALTTVGLRRYLHPYLSSKYCSLKTLDVSYINFDDEGLSVLADALACNKSLSALWFYDCFPDTTDVGWNALSIALCDSTSANSVYLSNHTLQEMSGDDVLSPWVLANRVKNRSMIVKFKILQSNPDLDMAPFLQWNLKFLPFIKFWFESMTFSVDIRPLAISSDWERLESTLRKRELSAIYKFVRAMPSAVAFEYKGYLAEQIFIMQVMGSELVV